MIDGSIRDKLGKDVTHCLDDRTAIVVLVCHNRGGRVSTDSWQAIDAALRSILEAAQER